MLTENNKCRYTLLCINTNYYIWALGSLIINYKLLNLNQRLGQKVLNFDNYSLIIVVTCMKWTRDANSRWSLIIQDKCEWNLLRRAAQNCHSFCRLFHSSGIQWCENSTWPHTDQSKVKIDIESIDGGFYSSWRELRRDTCRARCV